MAYKLLNEKNNRNKITAKIFSCNQETYKKIYKEAIKRAYLQQGKRINEKDIILEIVDLSDNGTKTIQQQRNPNSIHNRSISVYENDKLKYIIGISNTNYDEDKLVECNKNGKQSKYGSNDYHANTYFIQGINKIFEYYFDSKEKFPNVQLYFYLLDTDQKYPNTLFNLFSYRMLATIGFSILNIDKINFSEFDELNFSDIEAKDDIRYKSFNKLMNDMIYISKRNSGNTPPYIKCINEDTYDDESDIEEYNLDKTKTKYIYTFKGLGAGAYTSFFVIWTLDKLAKQENKILEFLFSKEKYNLKEKENMKETKDLPTPIKRLLDKAHIFIRYETSEEVLQQLEREKEQFEIAKKKNKLRNQELFRNNIRKKGILTKCCLCGCEVEDILEAAHLWGVSEIKRETKRNISKVLNIECMKGLVEEEYKEDLFYNKYMLANSGDNGVWLCKNHHGLFDNHHYCFDSREGKVIYNLSAEVDAMDFMNKITEYDKMEDDILTPKTRVFLQKREEVFSAVNNDMKYKMVAEDSTEYGDEN